MGGGAKKRKRRGNQDHGRQWKTKRKTRDIDEIDEDIQEQENVEKLLNQELDHDKPGDAQHYCIHCSRYFITNQHLESHFRSKKHKRRLKALQLDPYTQAEAECAADKGSYFAAKRRKVETQKALVPIVPASFADIFDN